MNKLYFGDNLVILQILTIEGLLNGIARADFPDLTGGTLTFKKA
jgi:hypothetical protein